MKTQQNNQIEYDVSAAGLVLKPEPGEKWHLCRHPGQPGQWRLIPGEKCDTTIAELDEDGKETGKRVEGPKNGKEIACSAIALDSLDKGGLKAAQDARKKAGATLRNNLLDENIGQQGVATLVDNTGKIVELAALPTSFRPDEQARPSERAKAKGEAEPGKGAVTDADVKAAGEPPPDFLRETDADKDSKKQGKHGR